MAAWSLVAACSAACWAGMTSSVRHAPWRTWVLHWRQRCTLAQVALAALGLLAGPAWAAAPVQIEDLSWTELRARIDAGARTVLLPLGGTEQNGPHMALGKHNRRVQLLAAQIAQKLGDAVVAPVLAYVPEGNIRPPTQHMRWAGTLSVPAPVFEAVIEATVHSLRQAGLCHVFLLGDHGGYRDSLDRVAARLNREKAAPAGCAVHPLPEYYRAASGDFARMLEASGHTKAEIGSHAGLADTSLMLALDPKLVRSGAMAAAPRDGDGVGGDPRRASAELGRVGVEHIIEASVAAIRLATSRSKP